MGKWYRLAGLLLVVAAVLAIAVARIGSRQGRAHPQIEMLAAAAANAPSGSGGEACCSPAPNQIVKTNEKPPTIPARAGRPCLVEFGSDECAACEEMNVILAQLGPRLAPAVDVVMIDTDRFPNESARWHLRLVPTQILLDAGGSEVARHESKLSAEELVALLREHNVEVK